MILDTTERAIKLSLRQGSIEAEAFASDNTILTVRIASGKVVEAKKVRESGLGIRSAIGKKVGFYSCNELSEEAAKRSVDITRAKPTNPKFNGFTHPKKSKKVRWLHDPKLENLDDGAAVELAEDMLQSVLDFDMRPLEASGALNLIVERCAISNTNGVQTLDKSTKIFGHLTVEAKQGESSEGQGWNGSTTLAGFDPGLVGGRAAELAFESLGASAAEPGTYDVIFEPTAAADIFHNVLRYALNGRDVYDRFSYFSGKLGESVSAEAFNVYDWGNMPGGLFSKTVDDEGYPTQKTSLIEKGALSNFIYDRYYGGIAKKRTTGNGLRLGDFGRSHMLEPTPYTTNLVIGPGKLNNDELMEDMGEGLLISRLWYTYPITPQIGNFSTTSRCGFFVSKGEIKGPVNQIRIHENLPKLLKQLDGIGNNQEQIVPWGASTSVCTPSVRFRDVHIK